MTLAGSVVDLVRPRCFARPGAPDGGPARYASCVLAVIVRGRRSRGIRAPRFHNDNRRRAVPC